MKDFSKLNSVLANSSFVAKLQIEVDSLSGRYDLILEVVDDPSNPKRVQIFFETSAA